MIRISKAKKQELYRTLKGVRDVFGEDYAMREHIIERCRAIAASYGFAPIATPHIERAELFTSTLGGTSDVVEKQMYTLKTRGGESVALRPEGTASIMRAYIEHGMHTWPQPVLLWYEGNFFRHESPQRGRLREFYQFGLEALGTDDAIADALIIYTMVLVLKDLGLEAAGAHINSLGCKECRQNWRKELSAYFRKHVYKLCKDCRRRLKENPLRILDCKEEACRELGTYAPQMVNHLCAACKTHFKEVIEYLDAVGVAYFLDHRLVRGLDYYSRTTFELFVEEETAEDAGKEDKKEDKNDAGQKAPHALGGGGRYDYLGETLGSRSVPAVGGAFGVDRLMSLLKRRGVRPKPAHESPKVFFVQLGTAAKRKSLQFIEELRKAKIPAAQSLSKDSLRSQLRIADRLQASFALILGQKEAMDETIIVRDMESGAQETLPFAKSIEYLKLKLKGKK